MTIFQRRVDGAKRNPPIRIVVDSGGDSTASIHPTGSLTGGSLLSTALLLLFALAGSAGAQPNLAEGFSTLPKNSKVAIVPTDIELFSISGGARIKE